MTQPGETGCMAGRSGVARGADWIVNDRGRMAGPTGGQCRPTMAPLYRNRGRCPYHLPEFCQIGQNRGVGLPILTYPHQRVACPGMAPEWSRNARFDGAIIWPSPALPCPALPRPGPGIGHSQGAPCPDSALPPGFHGAESGIPYRGYAAVSPALPPAIVYEC